MCEVVGCILSLSPSVQQIGIIVETLRYKGEWAPSPLPGPPGEGKQSESHSFMSNSL